MTKIYANIIQQVNTDKIRTEMMDDIEYLVVSSRTMPSDIIMNDIMYSGEQIDATINTIDETPAPMKHPMIDGKYVSASTQRAQNAFNESGGINKYVKKDGDSHVVDKWFMKSRLETTEQGKQLLAAINKGDPIHSSTGVIISKVAEKGKNKYGNYNYIANIDRFDHDAILIGECGAATPDEGVGLMVNSQEELEVIFVNLSTGLDMSESANKFREKLQEEVKTTFGSDYKSVYLCDHNADTVIFEVYENDAYTQYRASYEINGDVIALGQPGKVESEVVYKSADKGLFANAYRAFKDMFKPNSTIEQDDNPMKEKIIAALNAANVSTGDLNDDQLFDAYNKHMAIKVTANKADEPKPLTAEAIADLITNGVTAGIKAHTESQEIAVKTALVDQVIANSKSYTEEDKETLMATPEKVLNSMLPQKRAANLVDGIHTNNTEALSSVMPE
ncbi:MAG: hypothetical protein COA43_14790 [Robiginitomaculum sp.]|nr:MAG: hypothetical protein COA43_14790 [Robiginitomaculum sp.]